MTPGWIAVGSSNNGPLWTLVVTAGLIVLAVMSLGYAVSRFYRVPNADEALVKTGGRRVSVTSGAGTFVVPVLHRITRVSLRAIKIPIDRRGDSALPTQDKLMAEVIGELFVQVDPDDHKAILLAAQSLGTCDPKEMASVVKDKIDSLVTDALRTAAFKKTFLALNAEKQEFADEVIELLQADLAKMGLKLTAVSIPHIYQGQFTSDMGDVFAAEGRRNVADTVAKNRQETNDINRKAEIEIQKQDVDARKRSLALEYEQRQKEDDHQRQVEEYAAVQLAETAKKKFEQEQATEEAAEAKRRAIEQARIEASRAVEVSRAQAEAQEAVAREEASLAQERAEINRQREAEKARIAKEQELKVADQLRQQAIEEAEVAREVAVAAKREEEAAARAKQAEAEALQRAAEEKVTTASETEVAERKKRIAVIQAQEAAEQERIRAQQDKDVETTQAEADKMVAIEQAIAKRESAQGEADSRRVRAQGEADELMITAKAEFDAAEQKAEAKKLAAEATLAEGKAVAESIRLKVEAENQISSERLFERAALEAIRVAPDVAREIMAPIGEIAHDVKILQVNGLDGEGGGDGIPGTVLKTGLAAAGVLPFLKSAADAMWTDDTKDGLEQALLSLKDRFVPDAAAAADAATAPEPVPTDPLDSFLDEE